MKKRIVYGKKLKKSAPPTPTMTYDKVRTPEDLGELDKAGLIAFLNSDRPDKVAIWNMRYGSYSEEALDLSGAYLADANLEGISLNFANLKQATLSGCNFRKASLLNADLESAFLVNAQLDTAILLGAVLINADLRNSTLKLSKCSLANFHGADLRGSNFEGAELERSDLSEANASLVSFVGAFLNEAKLLKAFLDESILVQCVMDGCNLREASLIRANLSESTLGYANLERANLEGATLTRANLAVARLQNANLSNAQLDQANLEQANLEGAILHHTKLTSANLAYIQLNNAKLYGVHLHGSNLTSAYLDNVDLLTCEFNELDGIRLAGARLKNLSSLSHLQFFDKRGKSVIWEENQGDFSAAINVFSTLRGYFQSVGDNEGAEWAYVSQKTMEKFLVTPRLLRFLYPRWAGKWKNSEKDHWLMWPMWFGLQFSELLADYGTSLFFPIFWLIGLIVFFALIYFVGGMVTNMPGCGYADLAAQFRDGCTASPNPIHSFLFSLGAMTTIDMGSVQAYREYVGVLAALEAVFGIILTGLLGFVLGNKLRNS